MSVSRTALRLIALLFHLAGVLLLRKPVFGQSVTAAPTPQHLPASEKTCPSSDTLFRLWTPVTPVEIERPR